MRPSESLDESALRASRDEVLYLIGDRSSSDHLEFSTRQRLRSGQEEYSGGADFYGLSAPVAVESAFVPHGVSRTQELEGAMVGEDPIRTSCLSHQEGIG